MTNHLTDSPSPFVRITPGNSHFFFGYYDLPAVDYAGRHLCHKVRFRDHLPTPGDFTTLGWVPLPKDERDVDDDSQYQPFSETRAWNFQQGAMLQWLLSREDTCVYNTFDDGQFGSCIHNLRTGTRQKLNLPIANISQDGTKALCINMARVYDFRPGYGYEEIPDPFFAIEAPEDDGVFLMDLVTGNNRLLLSLSEAVRFLEHSGEHINGRKVVINHITFNPSASRFLFLLRTFPSYPGDSWTTFLLTANTAGGDLVNHPVWGAASHYHWRDNDSMLFYAKTSPSGPMELFLINDSRDSRQLIDPVFFRSDGHCSYSPDNRWILYDSYPDTSTPDCLRSLQVYDIEHHAGFDLGRFRSEPVTPQNVDLRCDLHPRWLPDGHSITFDSIHQGFRGIYMAKISFR